ncbi:MAG: hypothetical protein IT384_21035 [Deltaproteobacteria bacterium]|nr:hypothetical protein [Deltaproteobacteria bacterium]
MEEVKRGRVPFGRGSASSSVRPGAPNVHALSEAAKNAEARAIARKRPVLTHATAKAYTGNALTGVTLDARRPDLPPFLYNPPPAEIRARRRPKVERTYARPAPPPQHASAADPLRRIFNPKTRRVAIMQHVINTNPLVRAAFERSIVTRVVLNGRADGTITVVDPNASIAVSTGAMTNAPPMQNFYDLLSQLDREVMEQAARVAATANSSTGAYNPSTTPPALPFGLGLESTLGGEGPSGLTPTNEDDPDSEEEGSIGLNAQSSGLTTGPAGGTMLPTAAIANNAGNASTDIESQKLNMIVQRLNQMYTLISGMFSKYNQNATSASNNLR